MISYFDTSVLFASVNPLHENYARANRVLQNATSRGSIVSTTLHTYAELYNNLTRIQPDGNRLSPDQTYELIVEQLGPKLDFIELNQNDYQLALKRCADLNLVRGVIYDALHVQAALKAGADVLYTDNLRDFNRLVTQDDDLVVKGIR